MVPIDPVAKKMESPFLQGGGEMGRLIRAFDWSATPIGDPDQWPMCLKSTVSTILHSRHPMFLWWGAGLIQFYNDAYRPSMGNRGKHPGALGNKGKDTWPEIWTTIKPLIDSVLSGKEATWNEDQLIPIYRNGRLEEVYWTFGYSPVYNDSGKIEGVLVVCTETTAKVLNFRANKSSKEDLSFAIDAGQLGTWDLDPRTMRLGGNARLKLWFGLPDSDELLLDQALAVIHPKQRNKVMEAIQYALTPESGGLYDIEYTIINFITKEEKTVRATGKAIFDENKLAIRFSGIVQDMTERKELELLESKNRELQRSNANLEEFTHIASHDLKEPMRKISFFTDRLKTQLGGRLTEEDKTTLARIDSANKRMMALIDDLMLYSQISLRPIEMEELDLNDTVAKVLEDLEVDIQQKKAAIKIESLPIVRGYKVQLVQLFQNLIGNALKYHQDNISPVIEISSYMVSGKQIPGANAAELKKKFFCIEVKDNGIGFEQEHSERIFQMFQRLHGISEYRGTGVGLAISRKVADNHLGRITAESEPGKGSLFRLYLPV